MSHGKIKRYIVVVRLPGSNEWIIHSDENGEELKNAEIRLRECVKSYGLANTIFCSLLSFEADVRIMWGNLAATESDGGENG